MRFVAFLLSCVVGCGGSPPPETVVTKSPPPAPAPAKPAVDVPPEPTTECPGDGAKLFGACATVNAATATSVLICAGGHLEEEGLGGVWTTSCGAFEKKLPAVAAHAKIACDKDDRDACMLVARIADAVVVSYAFELVEPPCAKGKACTRNRTSRMAAAVAGATPEKDRGRTAYARACEKGNAEACVLLAELLRNESPAEAMKIARTACDAEQSAGCAIAVGLTVGAQMTDAALFTKAYELFAKRCDAGSAPSCTNAGYMLATGRGVKRDPEAAAARLDGACTHERIEGCGALIYLRGAGPFKAKVDLVAATKKLVTECEAGDAIVCLATSFAHEKGIGTKANAAKAKAYKKRACDAGLC